MRSCGLGSCGAAWLQPSQNRVAEKTIRAIYRNQPIALVGVAAYVLYYCKRFAPGVFYAMHGIGRAKNLRNKLKKLCAAPHRDGEAIAAWRHEPNYGRVYRHR